MSRRSPRSSSRVSGKPTGERCGPAFAGPTTANARRKTMTDADQGGDLLVRMIGIHMHYGKVVGLRNVNLDIGRNEIVGLVGDNGAGKSTLIKVLTGVEIPTAGRLRSEEHT